MKTSQKVTKAVIPAAGLGTRFLPATKAQPKEMLPIVDKPIIQYVIEDAVSSGITDIIIVTGSNKRAIEDHFDHSSELESYLAERGKTKELEEIKRIADMANFTYIRQKGPYGNGTPVRNAKNIIGDEPFVVLWGDDFIHANPPRTRQMLDVYEKYGGPILSLIDTDDAGTKKYGIADVASVEGNVYQINRLVEKPGPDNAPSRLASVSGYLLTPDIFPILDTLECGKGGELWLPDAIDQLRQQRTLYGCRIKDGKYYDCGNKLEYIKAQIDFGLKNPEMKDELQKYLTTLTV